MLLGARSGLACGWAEYSQQFGKLLLTTFWYRQEILSSWTTGEE